MVGRSRGGHMTKRAIVFFTFVFTALFVFMWKTAGAGVTLVGYGAVGSLYLAFIALPAFLEKAGRNTNLIFFSIVLGALFVFMGKTCGFAFASFLYGVVGLLLFLIRVLPRLLGDKGRDNGGAGGDDLDIYYDPTYSGLNCNIYHKDHEND